MVEPAEARLTLRSAEKDVWSDSQPVIRTQIYGPHFEHLAREWVMAHASPTTTGSDVAKCGPATVRVGSARLDLDILATTMGPKGRMQVCAIGEVKSGQERVGLGELRRLDGAAPHVGASSQSEGPQRLLVSRHGFTRELEQAARLRSNVELVDIHRLYAES